MPGWSSVLVRSLQGGILTRHLVTLAGGRGVGEAGRGGGGRNLRGGRPLLTALHKVALLHSRPPPGLLLVCRRQPRPPLPGPWGQRLRFYLLQESPFGIPQPRPSPSPLPAPVVPLPEPGPLMPRPVSPVWSHPCMSADIRWGSHRPWPALSSHLAPPPHPFSHPTMDNSSVSVLAQTFPRSASASLAEWPYPPQLFFTSALDLCHHLCSSWGHQLSFTTLWATVPSVVTFQNTSLHLIPHPKVFKGPCSVG